MKAYRKFVFVAFLVMVVVAPSWAARLLAADGPAARVDLLALVDTAKDAVSGEWTLKNGMLSCSAAADARLEFPYAPGEEYDLEVVFTRSAGNGHVSSICSAGGSQFAWQVSVLKNTFCAFALVGEQGAGARSSNPTNKHLTLVTNGKECVSLVKVRKSGLEAYVDGKLIVSLKTDYHNLSLTGKGALRDGTALGIWTNECALSIKSATVTEITGQGKALREGVRISRGSGAGGSAVAAANLAAGEVVGLLTPGLVLAHRDGQACSRWRSPIFSDDGQELAVVWDLGAIPNSRLAPTDTADCMVWNLATRKLTASAFLPVPSDAWPVIQFGPDARALYARFAGAGAEAGSLLSSWTVGAGEAQAFVTGPATGAALAVRAAGGQKVLVADGLGVKEYTGRMDAGGHWIFTPGAVVLTAGRTLRAPAGFSADGSVLAAVQDPGELAVWDLAKGQVRFRLPAPSEGALALLGFSRTRQRIFTAAKDGKVVHVVDGGSGSETGQIALPGGAVVESLACTADGEFLAVGGGNVLRLWAVATGKEIVALPVDGGGGHDIGMSADGQYLAAGGDDGSLRLWRIAAYTGHALAGPATRPAEMLDVAPAVVTREQELIYLYWGARRLLYLTTELAGHDGTSAALATLRQQAAARGQYLAGLGGAAAGLAAIYQALPAAMDQLAAAGQMQQATREQYSQRVVAASNQQVQQRHEQASRQKLAVLSMIVGSIDNYETVYSDPWYTIQVDTGPAIPGLFEYGMGEMLSSWTSSSQRQAEIDNARKINDATLREATLAALTQQADAYKKIDDPWLALAPTFGIEGLEPLTPEQMQQLLRDANRWKPLLDLLAQEEKWEQGKVGRPNPFTLARELLIQSKQPGQTPAALFTAAKELTAAVKLVPPGKVFDGDRAKLLEIAAGLALQAAEHDEAAAGKEEVEYAWSALQTAQALVAEALDATTGHLLMAGIKNGRDAEVLATAQAAVRRDPNSALARFLLARVQCAMGDSADGLDQLEFAVKQLGFDDMVTARSCREFMPSSERFRDLTTLSVTAQADPEANALLVTNHSPFALENVTLRWQYGQIEHAAAPSPPVRTAALPALECQQYEVVTTVYRLEPGQTCAMFSDHAAKGALTSTGQTDARKVGIPEETVSVTSPLAGATVVVVTAGRAPERTPPAPARGKAPPPRH